MSKKIGNLIFFILFFSILNSAEIKLNVSVDRNSVPLNQTIQFSIQTETSQDLPEINLPELKDFVVVGRSSSTQLQIINGRQSGSKALHFILQSKHQGKAQIPALRFTQSGNNYLTDPIAIEIMPPVAETEQPANINYFQDQDVLVQLQNSKKRLYVGEKAKIVLQIYYQRPFFQGPVYNPPQFEGLIAQELKGEGKDQTVTYQGRRYLRHTVVWEIAPIRAGRLEIPAVVVQYQPNPFAPVMSRRSQPLQIVAVDLPSNQPENFSGALGDFQIRFNLENKPILKTGEGLTFTIQIKGMGSLDSIDELKFVLPENVRASLQEIKEINKNDREYIYQFYFYQAGKIQLPAFQFSYFSPAKGKYITAEYSFPPLEVKPGQSASPLMSTPQPKITFQLKYWTNILKIFWLLMLIVFIQRYYIFQAKIDFCRRLRKLKKDNFVQKSHELFNEFIQAKYKFNPAGLSLQELTQRSPLAGKILQVYEELKYSGQEPSPEQIERLKKMNQKLFSGDIKAQE